MALEEILERYYLSITLSEQEMKLIKMNLKTLQKFSDMKNGSKRCRGNIMLYTGVRVCNLR